MSDVAAAVGVSRTAVSLVLNGRDARIPEATRERIRATAEKLGFSVSVAARELRTQKSSLVGFVGDTIASGPFAGDLIAGAQEAIQAGGGALVVINTGRKGDLGDGVVDELAHRGVGSLILATVLTSQVAVPRFNWATHVVLLNCFDPTKRFPTILPDDTLGGYLAAQHVVSFGHKSIAYVGGDPESYPIVQRLRGVRAALTENSLRLRKDWVVCRGWHGDAGFDGARLVLSGRNRPSAIICGNDRVALGVLDAAKLLGISVPDELSVVGFDDYAEIAMYTHPPLTTIRLPYFDMGQEAGRLMLMADPDTSKRTVPCTLVQRGSTARASASAQVTGLRRRGSPS